MQWFRLYDDMLDDPKAQQLSPVLFKHWINLLCLANKGSERGVLPSIADIAFRLRLTVAKAESVIGELTALGLVDRHELGLTPHNWFDRQKRSDDVTARTTKHKQERSRERSEEQPDPVLDTDTDTEKEADTEKDKTLSPDGGVSESTAPKYSPEFESFWSAYPTGHGAKKTAYAQWERLKPAERSQLVPAVHTWIACERWQAGYIKACELWIRDRLWEQEPPAPKPTNVTSMNRNGRMSLDEHIAGVREAEERERRQALGGQA